MFLKLSLWVSSHSCYYSCNLGHRGISPAACVPQPRLTHLSTRLLPFLERYRATGLSRDQLIASFLVLTSVFYGLFQLLLLFLTPGFEKEPLSLQIQAHTSRAGVFLTEIKPLLCRGLQWKRQVIRLGEFRVFLPWEAIFSGRVGTFVFRNKAALWRVLWGQSAGMETIMI